MTRWRVVHPEGLLRRSWGGEESLLYHAASGDTHLVNDVTEQVLRILERTAKSVQALAAVVAQELETECDEEFVRQVEQLVQHLDRIGLVEPVR